MKLICKICGVSPADGFALFRDNGALFYRDRWGKGKGPLFCAACAPSRVKRAILMNVRIDPETKGLADV